MCGTCQSTEEPFAPVILSDKPRPIGCTRLPPKALYLRATAEPPPWRESQMIKLWTVRVLAAAVLVGYLALQVKAG